MKFTRKQNNNCNNKCIIAIALIAIIALGFCIGLYFRDSDVYCNPTEEELQKGKIIIQYRLICLDPREQVSEIYYKSRFRSRNNRQYQRFSKIIPYTQWDFDNFEKITPALKKELDQIFGLNNTYSGLETFEISTTRKAIKHGSYYIYTVLMKINTYPKGRYNTRWRTNCRYLLEFQTVNPQYSTDASKSLILVPIKQIQNCKPIFLSSDRSNPLFLSH